MQKYRKTGKYLRTITLASLSFLTIVLTLLCVSVLPVSAGSGEAVEVVVTPQNPEIQVGESIVITAEGRDKDGNTVPVDDPHWEGDGVCGTITPDASDPSQATYTATLEGTGYALCYQGLPSSGGAYHSTDISIKLKIDQSAYLARIDVTPTNVTLRVSDTQLFTATGYDQQGNVYQFDPEYTTDGGSIDQNGKYTATIPGEFTVTVSAGGSKVTGEANISISIDQSAYLARIDVSPTNVTLRVSDTQLFTATGYDEKGNPVSFEPKWSADGGNIDQNGTYSATKEGTCTVTAANEDGTIKGTAAVEVTGSAEADAGSNAGWYIGGAVLAALAGGGGFYWYRTKSK